ncbi:esterase [bacterium CPR1]|nr:esterase [bacterium CPR1]
MRKKARLLLLLVCLVATAAVWAKRDDGLLEGKLTVDGRERTYRLTLPANLEPGRPVPLVLVFHGGGGNARQMARHTGFPKLARQEGFIAVFPDGWKKNWNDGREDFKVPTFTENVDDLAFIRALLDELTAKYPVDAQRIYATGISNGGIFSHFLAARMADRIRAAAPVVGGMAEPVAASFAPSRPVSLLIIQGTDDPLVPYAGGGIGFRGERGRIVSTQKALELWRAVDGCQDQASSHELPDLDPGDGCRVTCSSWSGIDGTEVVLYTVQGGGHGWPGASQYLPRRTIGTVCRDFEATRVIWEFFKSH